MGVKTPKLFPAENFSLINIQENGSIFNPVIWSLIKKARFENPCWSVIAYWWPINIFRFDPRVANYILVAN